MTDQRGRIEVSNLTKVYGAVPRRRPAGHTGPQLGPIEQAPFCALAIYPDLETKGRYAH